MLQVPCSQWSACLFFHLIVYWLWIHAGLNPLTKSPASRASVWRQRWAGLRGYEQNLNECVSFDLYWFSEAHTWSLTCFIYCIISQQYIICVLPVNPAKEEKMCCLIWSFTNLYNIQLNYICFKNNNDFYEKNTFRWANEQTENRILLAHK